jgi:hypothetical protein
MKCSNCKLEGYNKNNCPNCKEKEEERLNRLLEILPTETFFIALTYFSLSQVIQKSKKEMFGVELPDLLGTGGDLYALKNNNPGIVLGGMLSLAFEGLVDEEGFDLSILTNWLERQGITEASIEGLAKGELFKPGSVGF